jgi:hypothetical protein
MDVTMSSDPHDLEGDRKMERSIPKAFAACLLASLCLYPLVAQANLVQNGDFSLPSVDPADSPPYAMPSYWTATAVGLPVPDDGFSGIARTDTADFDKGMYLAIGGASLGTTLTLDQKISLAPGEYRLSFNFTFYTYGGDDVYESDTWRVLLNGSQQTVVTDHGESALPAGFEVDFVDEAAPYSLTFTLSHPVADFDLGFQLDRSLEMPGVTTVVTLDNVSLSEVASPVPVPGAAVLGAIGLSVAGWRLKRRTA